MWTIAFAEDENGVRLGKNRFDTFTKRYPQAMEMMHLRAKMLLTSLDAGCPISEAMQRGWIHPERGRVFAIDPGKLALRLYFCLDRRNFRLVILTVGEKKRQGSDIRDCARWASEIFGQEDGHGN